MLFWQTGHTASNSGRYFTTPSRLCQRSCLELLDHEDLFRYVMLPHNAMWLGKGKPKLRIVLRMSQHHHHAIGGDELLSDLRALRVES
jgi:hypothetical protein